MKAVNNFLLGLILAMTFLTSCEIYKPTCQPFKTVEAQITDLKLDVHPLKRYIVLSTGDTLKRIPKNTGFHVGDTYKFHYVEGTRKNCEIYLKSFLQADSIKQPNLNTP